VAGDFVGEFVRDACEGGAGVFVEVGGGDVVGDRGAVVELLGLGPLGGVAAGPRATVRGVRGAGTWTSATRGRLAPTAGGFAPTGAAAVAGGFAAAAGGGAAGSPGVARGSGRLV